MIQKCNVIILRPQDVKDQCFSKNFIICAGNTFIYIFLGIGNFLKMPVVPIKSGNGNNGDNCYLLINVIINIITTLSICIIKAFPLTKIRRLNISQ